jgi:hypothetical protein
VFDGLHYEDRLPLPVPQTRTLPVGLAITAAFSLAGLIAFALSAIYDPDFAMMVATALSQ